MHSGNINKNGLAFFVFLVCFSLALLLTVILFYSFRIKDNAGNERQEQTADLKSADSDKDGLSDYDELFVYKTNPNDEDTDRDGFRDGEEVEAGSDPLEKFEDLTIERSGAEGIVKSSEYEITGFNPSKVEKIEVEVSNSLLSKARFVLEDFKKGDVKWNYVLRAENGTLSDGENRITVIAYTKDQEIRKDDVIVVEMPKEEAGLVNVEWKKELEEIEQNCVRYCESNLYVAGKILNGDYKGQTLYLEVIAGMGTEYIHYILKGEEKFYLANNNIKIKGISDLPDEIEFPGTGYKLRKYYVANQWFDEIKTVKKMFTDAVLGDFYLSESGCLVVELPDHTAMAYNIIVPFLAEEGGAIDVAFNSGEKNAEEYAYLGISGCGALCYYFDVVKDIDENRLVKAGKTGNGEDIFEPKNKNDELLRALYDEKNTQAYYSDDWKKLEESRYSYEEFIDLKPLLYWKDPLGRWVQFKNRKFVPMAEMCKPVIYLYPEQTLKTSVKVQPNGGFTFSKPQYGNGWNVEAYPNGKIRDLRTGEVYDYLFWEGIGLNYPVKEEGWVVERGELSGFFDEKLSLLGLNRKEIVDFKAYWVARLSEKPYYKIYFLTKQEFDEIAPLELSPKEPRSVIRLMMTAKGLDRFESVPEQVLPETPGRNGFTVVEWGGALLR